MNTLNDFDYRRGLLQNVNYNEAAKRVAGFYIWLLENKSTKSIVDELSQKIKARELLDAASAQNRRPPIISTPEEIAAVGLELMKEIKENNIDTPSIARHYNFRPSFSTSSLQDYSNELFNRVLDPAIEFIRRELERIEPRNLVAESRHELLHPLELTESLQRFKIDNPVYERNAFIMMRFGTTIQHVEIVKAIRLLLSKYDIKGHRADDKEYHEDLFSNVQTYMHGCAFGVAVFEQLEVNSFNPNVSLEVGYMRGLRKRVCLLKDNSLMTLHTDLLGKLYRSFDSQMASTTIPSELGSWLRDKDIVSV